MTAEGPDAAVRRQVRYTGRVQGVCFRITAVDLARGRPVGGYVRNLPDGTVELEVEGRPADVDAFLAAVRDHFPDNIHHIEQSVQPPTGACAGFEIRY